MDMRLFDEGDFEGFGRALARLRKDLKPGKWTQHRVADQILEDIALAAVYTEALTSGNQASHDPRWKYDERPHEALGAARTLFASELGQTQLVVAPQFVTEARDLHPDLLDQLMLRAVDSPNADHALAAVLTAEEALRTKWRSRIANVEAGRRVSRPIADFLLRAVQLRLDPTSSASAQARPTGTYSLQADLPSWGMVPRRANLQDFFSSKGRIVVPQRWLHANPDALVQIGGRIGETILFRPGELVGIIRTSLMAKHTVALVQDPTEMITFGVIEDGYSGFRIRIASDDPLETHREFDEKWTILGYVVCREWVDPAGWSLLLD